MAKLPAKKATDPVPRPKPDKPLRDWKPGMTCRIARINDQPLPLPVIGFITGDAFSPGGIAGHYGVTIPCLDSDQDGRCTSIKYCVFQVPELDIQSLGIGQHGCFQVVDHLNDLDFMIEQERF